MSMMPMTAELHALGRCWQREDQKVWNGRCQLDSRQTGAGDMFVALTGERTDGHRFIERALQVDAAVILARSGRGMDSLTDRSPWQETANPGATGTLLIEVADVPEALAHIAARRRKTFAGRVIGVTGSYGKTTMKEFLRCGLPNADATHGNRNNNLGVPQTLINMNPDASDWIVEMGMNHPGELDTLGRIVQPDLLVYTPLGTAHVGQAEGDWIVKAKTELLRLPVVPREVWIPTESPAYLAWSRDFSGQIRLYGIPTDRSVSARTDLFSDTHSDIAVSQVCESFPDGSEAQVCLGQGDRALISWDIPTGDYAAAAALAWHLGEGHCRSFSVAGSVNGRMEISAFGNKAWLVNDAYNAAPESMMASADWAQRRIKDGYKVTVLLGEMAELGTQSKRFHSLVWERWLATGARLALWQSRGAWPPSARKYPVCHSVSEWLEDRTANIYYAKGSQGSGLQSALRQREGLVS